MNYNIETGAIENVISQPICNRVINCDVSEDINLPEGFPDVRRVLALKENILSPARFIGAKTVDMSGALDYTLIYLATDGNICSLPFSSEYSFSLPLECGDTYDSVSVICSLCSDGSNIRISTPRRLQVRAGIRASAVCFAKTVCGDDIVGSDDDSAIQRLELDAKSAFFDCESSDIVTLSDEYLLSEGDRIIYSDADVFINDVRVDGEVVRVSGEVTVKLLLQNGESIDTVLRRLPFDAETELDELELSDDDILCRAYGNVNELNVSVSEGRAHVDVGIVLEVCIAQNRDIRYTRDIYSTKQTCKAEYKTISLPVILFNKNANMTQSERLNVSDIGVESGTEILDIWGRAICEEGALENRRYVLRGKVKYKMLCRREGEISVCETELPFKYESELGELEISGVCADVKVMGARARFDGENLFIESELAISASAYGLSELEMLSKATFGEAIEQKKNQFVVCFKSSGESVFELAKRYAVPVDKITDEAEKDLFVIIER
ncbi:MAG: hypothetical protein E7678_01915 [Ruminococcaceae bacterium]|nr:hypothetical protein [Oscillospiraceae bacterium]